MKAMVVLLAGLLLCGCIYDVPFVDVADLSVDKAVVGAWEKIPDEGKASDPDDTLVILPFSGHEYVVVDSHGLYFRAYPVQIGDSVFIQLEWLNAEEHPYHLCRYSVKDSILTVELLNEDVVSPEISDPVELRKVLLANPANPDLFEDSSSYRKLDK